MVYNHSISAALGCHHLWGIGTESLPTASVVLEHAMNTTPLPFSISVIFS
jgi:hypothetical protein